MKRNSAGRIEVDSIFDESKYVLNFDLQDQPIRIYDNDSYNRVINTQFNDISIPNVSFNQETYQVEFDNANAIPLQSNSNILPSNNTIDKLNGRVVVIDWAFAPNKTIRETSESNRWSDDLFINYTKLYDEFYDKSKITTRSRGDDEKNPANQKSQIYLHKYGFLFKFQDIFTLMDYLSANKYTTFQDTRSGTGQELVYNLTFLSDTLKSALEISDIVISPEDLQRPEDEFPIKRPDRIDPTIQDIYQQNIPDIVLDALNPDIEFRPLFVSSSYIAESGIPIPTPSPPLSYFKVSVGPDSYSQFTLEPEKRDEIEFSRLLSGNPAQTYDRFANDPSGTRATVTIFVESTFNWLAYLDTVNSGDMLLQTNSSTTEITLQDGRKAIKGTGSGTFRVSGKNGQGILNSITPLTIIPDTLDSKINQDNKKLIKLVLIDSFRNDSTYIDRY